MHPKIAMNLLGNLSKLLPHTELMVKFHSLRLKKNLSSHQFFFIINLIFGRWQRGVNYMSFSWGLGTVCFGAADTHLLCGDKVRVLVPSNFSSSQNIWPCRKQFARVFDAKGKIPNFFIFLFYFCSLSQRGNELGKK